MPIQKMCSAFYLSYNLYCIFFYISISFFFLKTFSKTVTAILASVKAREDGKLGKPGQPLASMVRPGTMGHHPPGVGAQGRPGAGGMMPGTANPGMLSQPRQLPNYNR